MQRLSRPYHRLKLILKVLDSLIPKDQRKTLQYRMKSGRLFMAATKSLTADAVIIKDILSKVVFPVVFNITSLVTTPQRRIIFKTCPYNTRCQTACITSKTNRSKKQLI